MKNIITLFILLGLSNLAFAQADIYPGKSNPGKIYLLNATVHVGDGTVLEKTTVVISKGKIAEIGSDLKPSAGDSVYDASGKQLYPGLILPDSDLGLKEIGSGVPGSNDYYELGDINPDVRSLVAYDANSMIIGTLRANGILLASVSPEGGYIHGLSSVVQLDAWSWQDAAYKTDNALHITLPSFNKQTNRFAASSAMMGIPLPDAGDAVKKALVQLENIKSFFRQAKSYFNESSHTNTNIKFEAIRGLFEKKQKLFVHADEVKQMLACIDFVKEFGFDVVVVGGAESWQIADLLKQYNIAVVLREEHSLPGNEDDDVDQPYKTPSLLQKAGVLFALNDTHEESRYRNLSFNAGTGVAYGLTKEQALQAITLNAAKILGIDDITGSITIGKDANIVISDGDILDMKSSKPVKAFIQGRVVSIENKQTQLYDRYIYKYGLKK